jgi:ABC-type branched-subunit amino acid transport system permease subunit
MNLLIYGAPESSPDLFHAIPEGIIDPFLYAEVDGRRAATVSVLDADKVAALRFVVIGLAIMAFMAFRPQGIFGKKEELHLDA